MFCNTFPVYITLLAVALDEINYSFGDDPCLPEINTTAKATKSSPPIIEPIASCPVIPSTPDIVRAVRQTVSANV